MANTLRGYKVTDQNGQCRGFQFEVGKEYKHDGALKICASGFHFCLKAAHCFSYYDFNSSNKVFEVEAIGEHQTHLEDSKIATDHIRIIRQLEWSEVLRVANDGKDNTGHSNTGNSNTGNRNTGNRNAGNRNAGNSNTGDWNTGNSNTGYSNAGNSNTGNSNTGNSNAGNSNTGDWNTGNSNTGYSNAGNSNTGAFCTIDAPFRLFNKASKMTEEEFLETRAYSLMRNGVDTKIWVYETKMTDAEKLAFPSYKTAEGYLKDIPFKDAFQNAWHNWGEESRAAFTSLPNFNSKIFKEITGVKANK